jgi:hypothetical protein
LVFSASHTKHFVEGLKWCALLLLLLQYTQETLEYNLPLQNPAHANGNAALHDCSVSQEPKLNPRIPSSLNNAIEKSVT